MDRNEAVRYAKFHWPDISSCGTADSVTVLYDFLQLVRDKFQDPSPARSRRLLRMPFSLHLLYHRLNTCSHDLKSVLKHRCWQARVAWFKQLRLEAQKKHLDKGGVLCRPKKLHKVSSLRLNQDVITDDSSIAVRMAHHFEH